MRWQEPNGAANPSEGGMILQFFRVLSGEEQRIAYAILGGMRLQKDLDAQNRDQASTRAGA